MEKGFKTLELIGDLDDKYIYEASRPWKKQHRFFHIQRSWKTVAAGVILLIMVGGTLRYQEEVKAALQRVTSWIGQALGIENGDTDFYTNVVGKSISRDGITITLNEIVMDSKNLWIAYSDSEDLNNKNHIGKEQKDLIAQNTDSDTQDTIEDKILFTEVRINGQEIQQGLGQRTVNNNDLSENSITVEDFTIGEEINTEGTVNIEFKVWLIAMSDAETWENIQKIQANTQPYTFKLTTSKEELEKNTDLARKDSADSEVVGISEMLQDPELLKRLEEILAGASFDEAKECPYNGILTLTKADGTQVVVRLASDGCDSMVYGSYSFYQAAGGEVAEIWDMFPEVKAEIVK